MEKVTVEGADLAKEIANLSNKARSGTLQPDQVQEGSLTMTNFGMYDSYAQLLRLFIR